jgi:hypothetical protein
MIRKPLAMALALGAGMLVMSAFVKYLQAAGSIDAETGRRVVQVAVGLLLAGYGNYMPKRLAGGPAPACATARAQSALRVGGWSMTLAGLAHAVLWAFAPVRVADVAATAVVAIAVVITVTFGVWAFTHGRSRPGHDSRA